MGNSSSKSAWKAIQDKFESLEEVQDALRKSGLESCDLIIAVDFTKSNEWSGEKTFNGHSLHATREQVGVPNPYEQVITIIGRTLKPFDDDELLPTYGFGDSNSRQTGLFSFQPNEQPVHGFANILSAYHSILRNVNLSGGTSFAPAINKAIDIVIKSGYQYHICLIIADGQVSADCMADTTAAIVRASHFPLSIVMVGVGDGPWDDMKTFDDKLPSRAFDNFQFVNFTELMVKAGMSGYSAEKCEAYFAMHALMEVPEQYSYLRRKGIIGKPAPPSRLPPRVTVFDPPGPRPSGSARFNSAPHGIYGVNNLI